MTTDNFQVQHNHNEKNGVFFIEDNSRTDDTPGRGKQVATMRYVFAGPSTFIIEHTEVDKACEGKGLGKLLVKAAVDFARSNNLKILPLCPYAKAVFQKTPDYKDVLR